MITPEQAQEALEWWPRGVFDHGAAEEALRTIAGMRVEYAVQVDFGPDQPTCYVSEALTTYPLAEGRADWFTDIAEAKEVMADEVSAGHNASIVTRLTTTPEVVA